MLLRASASAWLAAAGCLTAHAEDRDQVSLQTHGSLPQLEDQYCQEPGSVLKLVIRRQPGAEEQPFRSEVSAPSYREQAVPSSAIMSSLA